MSTTTSQPSCKVVTILQGCEHLAQITTTLSQSYKVAARLLQPSYFCMGTKRVHGFELRDHMMQY